MRINAMPSVWRLLGASGIVAASCRHLRQRCLPSLAWASWARGRGLWVGQKACFGRLAPDDSQRKVAVCSALFEYVWRTYRYTKHAYNIPNNPTHIVGPCFGLLGGGGLDALRIYISGLFGVLVVDRCARHILKQYNNTKHILRAPRRPADKHQHRAQSIILVSL